MPGCVVVEVCPVHAGAPTVDGVLSLCAVVGGSEELSDLSISDRGRLQLCGTSRVLGVAVTPPQDGFDLVVERHAPVLTQQGS